MKKITGSPEECPYDVSKYSKPENPTLPELGGKQLASNNEEYLLLELLPAVAKGFLRRRREEEFKAEEATKAPRRNQRRDYRRVRPNHRTCHFRSDVRTHS